MIYLKSAIGGFVALVLAFVLFVVWIKRNLIPKGASFGFNPADLLTPKLLLLELGIFMLGFLLVWLPLRRG